MEKHKHPFIKPFVSILFLINTVIVAACDLPLWVNMGANYSFICRINYGAHTGDLSFFYLDIYVIKICLEWEAEALQIM